MVKSGIILPHIHLSTESLDLIGDINATSRLKQALLYWEHVAAPLATEEFFDTYIGIVPQLAQSGVIETEDLDIFPKGVVSENSIDIASRKFTRYIKGLRDRPNESWGILPIEMGSAGVDNTVEFLARSSQSKQMFIQCSLFSTLPVPDKDVTIDDILNFRNSRIDQLRNVHNNINNISSLYSKLDDAEEPMLKAISELEIAIDEYRQTSKERFSSISFQTLKFTIAVTTAGIAASIVNPAIAAFIGVAAERITSAMLTNVERSLPKFNDSGPLLYVAEVEKELIK